MLRVLMHGYLSHQFLDEGLIHQGRQGLDPEHLYDHVHGHQGGGGLIARGLQAGVGAGQGVEAQGREVLAEVLAGAEVVVGGGAEVGVEAEALSRVLRSETRLRERNTNNLLFYRL